MIPGTDIPTRSLNGQKVPFEALKYVPEESALYYQFVPIGFTDGVLEVGMIDPDNMEARDALQFIANKENLPFKIFVISKDDFDAVIKSYGGLGSQVDKALGDFATEAEEDNVKGESILKQSAERPEVSLVEEAPVTKIVAVILQHASAGNASDIHIEPVGDRVRVRFRVDGILYTSIFLPNSVHDAVVARIKILTNMKLDEKRKPQDGRFSATVDKRKVDFRVSSLPTYFGEKIAIRILDPDKKLITLPSLGLSNDQQATIKEAINRPYGMILLTGPTGSGKTTTLYSMLNEIDREKYNVVSLEDPIEYDIPGVNQSQVQPEIGYTFANGLRSILRQDPDIIMVGEIRDKETARLAVQAALTGHLVFSTLHTNNAIGVVPRLIDMGVDPYLIPPTLIMIIGQRLVPMLCEEGKKEEDISESMKKIIEREFADLPAAAQEKFKFPEKVFQAQAAPTCPSGTRGRLGVFEILSMDRELEKIILTNPVDSAIYNYARSQGFTTLKEDAILKAFSGRIPFEEVNKL